jgi:hypothetical protein
MHMQMHHRLPGRRPRIDPNIIAIRLEARVEHRLDLVHELHQRPLLLRRRLEPGRHHPMRHDQRMPLADRIAVEERKAQFVGGEPVSFGDFGEWGGHGAREFRGVRMIVHAL